MKYHVLGIKYFVIGAGLLLVSGGVYAYQTYFRYEPQAAMAFINAYSAYEELMRSEEAYVYVPGQGNNASRQKLNEYLNKILAEDRNTITEGERLTLSRAALEELAVLKDEIDVAQASHAAIYAAIDSVDDASRGLESGQLRQLGGEVVGLMRQRQRVTAQITSLQSATNAHAEAILDRIVAEQGSLPDSLIIYINEGTLAAEERFDDLNELYSELSEVREALSEAHGAFVAAAI